jgi:hypothetical protein
MHRRLLLGILATNLLVIGGCTEQSSLVTTTNGFITINYGWMAPMPTHESFHDVWGAGPADKFAVTDNGGIYRYDGIEWDAMAVPARLHLRGIWGVSATKVWAVGDRGCVLFYDGKSWSIVPEFTDFDLEDVWGSSDSDIWVVAERGGLFHYDGSDWSNWTDPLLTTNRLRGVWGRASDDIYAVGNGGTVLMYDGTWTNVAHLLGTNTLYDVWGTATDVYMCGTLGKVWKYDGTWGDELHGLGVSTLYGVHGTTSGDDMFFTGTGGSFWNWNVTNGWNDWSDATISNTYESVAVVSATDVCVVANAGQIVSWNGASLSRYDDSFQVVQGGAFDVWAASESDVFVAAVDGVARYDGSGWTLSVPSNLFYAVYGFGPNDVWAVGSSGMWHYDGSWTEEDPTADLSFKVFPVDVWGTSSDNLYVVEGKRLFHRTGTGWVEVDLSRFQARDPFTSISGTGPDDIHVVGGAHNTFHWDGITWSPRKIPMELYGIDRVDAFAPGQAVGIGRYGVAYRYRNKRWDYLTTVFADPNYTYTSGVSNNRVSAAAPGGGNNYPGDICVFGDGTMVAVGWEGAVHHFDGAEWRNFWVPTSADHYEVFAVSKDAVYVVGAAGYVIKLDVDL